MADIFAEACLSLGVYLCCEVCLSGAFKTVNQPLEDSDDDFDEEEAENANVFLVICALDYRKTSNPLTCSIDGQNMEALARACHIPSENVVTLYDHVPGACTKDNVTAVLQEMGEKCGPDDTFVFYYSGHGTNMRDQSGDEEDGQDEAFCFVDEAGQINYESCMNDDDFAKMITEAIPAGTRMLVLTDCCHSGTICDFDAKKSIWRNRRAVSITGCLDGQTSGDIGRGGIFTHSMMCAIAELQEEDVEEYSAAKLYNRTLVKDEEIFNSKQDITCESAPGFLPNKMPWPLIPKERYQPPLNKRC